MYKNSFIDSNAIFLSELHNYKHTWLNTDH